MVGLFSMDSREFSGEFLEISLLDTEMDLCFLLEKYLNMVISWT